MRNIKTFQSMTAEERKAWLAQYQQFLVDFAQVESLATLTVSMKEVVLRGLSLLEAFVYCRSFVAETLRVKDFHRRLKVLRRLTDRVTEDLRKITRQNIDLTDPALLTPHVGRPTREESAARALVKEREEEIRRTAPNLFTDADSEKEELPAGPMAAYPAPPKYRSLVEIKWLLSPTLQERVESIRDHRAIFEESSTRAKQMAEDKRSADDIAPYAQQAAQELEIVEQIYAAVDDELQGIYVRLNEDTAYIAAIAEKSRLDNKELRTLLRPYWDKLSVEEKELRKASVIAQIKANDPAQAALRKEAEEKQARVNAIRKYLQRTDKPNSKARIKGMEGKLTELRELIGDEAEKYAPLLVAAKEDYENNIKPAEEAKRVAKEKKSGKK